MAKTTRGPRWLRPLVDGAMTLALLFQMLPGKLGNTAHEVLGIAFAALFVLHHLLNRGWAKKLGRQATLRSQCILFSDGLLTICMVGTVVSGLMMSRSITSLLAVPSAAHVVRPLHGALAYMGLMICAFHVGSHLRIARGYVGKRGGVHVPRLVLLVAVVAGLGAFVRLQVASKLLGQPSFPDAVVPLGVQLALHAALCLPFLALGSIVDATVRGGKRDEK